MKNKLTIFLLSILLLFGLIFIALFASVVFSIKEATSPIELTGNNNIAVLEVKGFIMPSTKIIEKIAKIKEKSGVQGVIMRIESPGGAVGPAQEIYSEIMKLKEIMPVFASLGSIATSGGYYIAAACDRIYSNPGTLTGSIGVIMNFVDLQKVYDFLKVKRHVLKSGKYKDIGSVSRDMSPAEKNLLQNLIDSTFNQFTDAVQATRKLTPENLKLVSDGRIMTGLQAKKLGLIDEIGTLNDAIDGIAKEANLEEKPEIIFPLRKKEKLMDYLLYNSISDVAGKLKNYLHSTSLFFLPEKLFEVRYENN